MVKKQSLAVLQLLSLPGFGPARLRAAVDFAAGEGIDLGDTLDQPSLLKPVLNDKQASEYATVVRSTEDLSRELEDCGIDLITSLDVNYPALLKARLSKYTPPLLMVRGNVDLLHPNSTGFCGSRKASDKGLEVAHDVAEQLAERGVNIVSGYAAGVDFQVHRAALQSGGTTTLVLAEGMKHFRIKRELEQHWSWDRVLVLSEFPFGVTWSVRNAMQRNETICGLVQAMVLIEAGATGGSIAAGRAALKMGVPLFAPIYDGMPGTAVGNEIVLNEGAFPLLRNRHTHRANISSIVATVNGGGPTFAQHSLF